MLTTTERQRDGGKKVKRNDQRQCGRHAHHRAAASTGAHPEWNTEPDDNEARQREGVPAMILHPEVRHMPQSLRAFKRANAPTQFGRRHLTRASPLKDESFRLLVESREVRLGDLQ